MARTIFERKACARGLTGDRRVADCSAPRHSQLCCSYARTREGRTMHIYLETERLILRQFTADDVDNLFELNNDPEVVRLIGGETPTPRDMIEQDYLPWYLARYERDEHYGFWAAIEKCSGAFL